MPSEYNLDLHLPQKREDLKLLVFHAWKRGNWGLSENNGSLMNKREKFMKGTTATSHANAKIWVELNIFFETRTLGYFPDKYHGCCNFY